METKVLVVATPSNSSNSIYADLEELFDPLFAKIDEAYTKQYQIVKTKAKELELKELREVLKNKDIQGFKRTKKSKGDKHRNRNCRWS